MNTLEQQLRNDVDRLQQWVNDLLAGMYVNCVYCGHRYGPNKDTPVAMADVLKAHIEQCPEHPLAEARARIAELEEACRSALWNLEEGADAGQAMEDLDAALPEEE